MGVLIEQAASAEKKLFIKNALNHYCTSYTQSHNKTGPWPRLGHHYGTGYSSNLRPAVYYTPNLDKEDNRQLGLSLLNPESQTWRDFQPIRRAIRGQPALTPAGQERESGYLQHRFLPPAVPMSLKTEYKGCFIPHQPPPSVSRGHCVVGEKGESGFTEGESLQSNTFLPHFCPTDDARRMGRSMMKSDFLPKLFLQGSEECPGLVTQAARETGFTRDTVDPLAHPASLLAPPVKGHKQKSILHFRRFSGKMSPSDSSGFTHNAPTLKTNTPPPEPAHYFTHYQHRFCDVTAAERLRSGWTRGGIHTNRASGYAGRDTDRFNLRG
ncbi:protein phosphatase 1 regulatory subunit 32 [Clupea harengus]|uniref:Protein phosphatase 1 regulatory subunit 32 n=1 Tax=Clupea harengus TaxID=7950 RepID=A0A8M1K753_CLUHA|nr:protein phosphatase 1 regulatory subunit 32 [Clupea harengus]